MACFTANFHMCEMYISVLCINTYNGSTTETCEDDGAASQERHELPCLNRFVIILVVHMH